MSNPQISLSIKTIDYASAKWHRHDTVHLFLTCDGVQLSLFTSREAVERLNNLLAEALAQHGTDPDQIDLPGMAR